MTAHPAVVSAIRHDVFRWDIALETSQGKVAELKKALSEEISKVEDAEARLTALAEHADANGIELPSSAQWVFRRANK